MAGEGTRSSGMTADSYLGSLISLTSKSDIRYEGVLFDINTAEASIGLRNVRSFGTEGRRKDAPQVPATDKVYEYIVFRGSDIKDLQVKSSPPVQPASSVHNDPAIIQSHYTPPTLPSSLPAVTATAGAGSLSEFGSQLPQHGIPRPTYPNSVSLYPPIGNLTSWNPSAPPSSSSGLSAPGHWQGYYGPSGSFQSQQQPLIRSVQGLPMQPSFHPPSAQPPIQYSTMNPSLPTGAPNTASSRSTEFPPPLLQPIVSSTVSMQSTMVPVQSSVLSADSSTLMPKAPSQAVPVVSQSTNLPMVSSTFSNMLDKNTIPPLIPNQSMPASSSQMPFNSEPLSAVGGASTSPPALVTPGQFLQPGPTISRTSQIAQKDVEVVPVSSFGSTSQAPAATAPMPVSTEAQGPLLPLPSPSNVKMNGVSSQTRYINRGGGRGRGRGNQFYHAVANFTEDFDFEAMNEKFKKDEVWGHLGKSKVDDDDDGLDLQDEEEFDVPQVEKKPVYKKDDFFDSLSCNALDRETRNGRPRFSEQMRLDTETFGDFSRNRGFRGGRGPGRGGRSRSGYYGRGYGYGYGGRGRGNNVYRAI